MNAQDDFGVSLYVCQKCGAWMGNVEQHEAWHRVDTEYDVKLAYAVEDLVAVMHRINLRIEGVARVHAED